MDNEQNSDFFLLIMIFLIKFIENVCALGLGMNTYVDELPHVPCYKIQMFLIHVAVMIIHIAF